MVYVNDIEVFQAIDLTRGHKHIDEAPFGTVIRERNDADYELDDDFDSDYETDDDVIEYSVSLAGYAHLEREAEILSERINNQTASNADIDRLCDILEEIELIYKNGHFAPATDETITVNWDNDDMSTDDDDDMLIDDGGIEYDF